MMRTFATAVPFLFLAFIPVNLYAQDMNGLIARVKSKLDAVKDYQAQGKLKTDVAFLKVPVSAVDVYFKSPDRYKIKKKSGISLLPKGGVGVNLNALMTPGSYVALAAGETRLTGIPVKIVKLLPTQENSDIILTTLYIDEQKLLIRKAVTTTKDNGTFQMDLSYGRFERWGLPDKVIVSFNTRDYKLPKGITFEYEAGEKPVNPDAKTKDKSGRVEITYESYTINKGLSDDVFK